MIKMKQKVRFTRSNAGRRRIVDVPPAEMPKPAGRVPRVAKLKALAIRFDGLLRDGIVSDQSELARLAKVTQPRMTQIMNLLHLAADIQEEILFLPDVLKGNDPINEKMLRPINALVDWRRQREMWRELHSSELA